MNQRITLKDVQITVNNQTVGGAEELDFSVSRNNTVAYEGGNYKPVEIIQGEFNISGSLTRAFIDVDLLKTLTPSDKDLWDSFTLIGTVVSGKTPGRTLTVMGVVFKGFDLNLALSDYTKNRLDFDALDYKLN